MAQISFLDEEIAKLQIKKADHAEKLRQARVATSNLPNYKNKKTSLSSSNVVAYYCSKVHTFLQNENHCNFKLITLFFVAPKPCL